MKANLIVIEGSDGSGKTTQTDLLLQRLKKEGVPSESLRFPRYEDNLFGALIRECLDGKHGDFIKTDPKIASVLYACDRFETMDKIKTWLAEGKTVVLDRYVTSNQIHQGGKLRTEKEREDFLVWLSKMEYDVLHILKPSVVFYLDMTLEASIELISKREGIKDAADSDFEYLKNSKEAGKFMLQKDAFWKRVDCMEGANVLPPETIHEKIWSYIENDSQ